MGYTNYISYPIYFSSGSTNPLDSTTYYLGMFDSLVLGTSATGAARALVIRKGTIRNITLQIVNATQDASNEATTYNLRINNTTDYPLSSTDTFQTGTHTFTNLQIPVNKDDYLFIKIATPAWATNPTGTVLVAIAEVQV